MMTSLLLLILLAPLPSQKISIYLAAPMKDGFVDTNKGVEDSIKDIRKRLAKDKRIVIVDDPSRADLVLTVVARGIHYERTGQTEVTTNYFDSESSTRVETTKQDIYSSGMWVKTVLTFGHMQMEINGGYSNEPGGWGACATQIADDVRSWIAANAIRIVQLRTVSK
jgi:hypothetical protein